MKTLVIVFIASIALALFGVSLAAASPNSAAHDLAAAKLFAFGGVGAAFAQATSAGKLYILVGLRRCDRSAYQKILDSVARPNDDVEIARGCMISREPFRQLLSQIRDGRFDDYLSQPAW